MSICILGDTHGQSRNFTGFLKSDYEYCIQLGDFGFLWKKWDLPYNKFLNKFESEYPTKKIFTILGNHENYDIIEKLPEEVVFGARARKIRNNIWAIERGEILNLEDLTFLCIGGADSTDKAIRIDMEYTGKKSWWSQETIQQKDIENALNNIDKYNNKVNVVCSHCEPASFVKNFTQYLSDYESEKHLQDLFQQVDFDVWFGGHIHENIEEILHDKRIVTLGIGESIILNAKTTNSSF